MILAVQPFKNLVYYLQGYDLVYHSYFDCSQQAATGVFGLGAVQTRCVKTYSTDPLPLSIRTSGTIPLRMARLQWHNGKTVALMLSDGSETRYQL